MVLRASWAIKVQNKVNKNGPAVAFVNLEPIFILYDKGGYFRACPVKNAQLRRRLYHE